MRLRLDDFQDDLFAALNELSARERRTIPDQAILVLRHALGLPDWPDPAEPLERAAPAPEGDPPATRPEQVS